MQAGTIRVPFVKHPLSRYVFCGIAAMAMGIGAMATVNWLEYCAFLFGLTRVIFKNGDSIDDVSTVSDLKSAVCHHEDIKELYQAVCPKFCDTVQNLKEAGEIMQGLGIATIVLVAIAVGAHILAYRGTSIPRPLMSSLIVLPCLVWIVGFVVYCSIANFSSIKKTQGGDYVSVANWSLEASFYVGIIEALLQLAMTVLGLYFLRQESKQMLQAGQPLNQY